MLPQNEKECIVQLQTDYIVEMWTSTANT